LKEKWDTFRFTNDQLQSSLIKAIREAGIEHKVAEDGTVLYSEEQSIENSKHSIERIIDQVVGTVFPTSYYRTAIPDRVKADRYRRFKKFSGTPLIEEIRGGESYFVQEIYEKLYLYKGIPTQVSYILADDGLEPEKVTELLGVSPTFACLKGEPFTRPFTFRNKKAAPPSSRTGWWELCSIPHINSNDENLHLEWLLTILEPVELVLKSLAEKIIDKDFRVLQVDIVRPEGSIGGLSLPGSMLARLSVLCDRVDIRFRPDDYIGGTLCKSRFLAEVSQGYPRIPRFSEGRNRVIVGNI
jgi:hypothetical protein